VLLASTACFSLAYFSKITFVYVLVIPFVIRYLLFLSDRINAMEQGKSLLKDWGMQSITTAVLGAIFYFKWYKPNQAVFDMVKANQGGNRFDVEDVWNRVTFNLEHFIATEGVWPFVYFLPIAVILLLFRNGSLSRAKLPILFGLVTWFVVELHHAVLINPPIRYLIPLFVSGLALISFSLAEFYADGFRKKLVLGLLVLFGGYNLTNYGNAVFRRTNQIENVRAYLSNYDLSESTILGVWGTTLASETKAKCIPIWSDFNMKEKPLEEYQPRIVFTEHNQADSGEAFTTKGIDLKAQADSMRQFNVWRYKINLYWMKSDVK
ncbi:MAG: hypothetical protein ACPG5W_11350, partial [Flavobacteriales bacterium]